MKCVLQLTALLALGACGPKIDDIEFAARTVPPGETEALLDYETVEISQGVAVDVIVRPTWRGEEIRRGIDVDLRVDDLDIAGADPGLDDREFVLYGVGEGDTELEVLLDGVVHHEIEVSVRRQR